MKKAVYRFFSAVLAVCIGTASFAVNTFGHEFEDINYHWAKSDIEKLVEAGIFSGVTQYSFQPNASVTRGMLAVVVCRILDEDPENRVAFFRDVDNNKYYAPYIAWAYEKQLFSGYEDITFRADEPVTRQEMFCILERVLKYKDEDLKASSEFELSYADEEQISSYAVEAVKLLSELGYINGNENNMINPNNNATRGELCSLIAKIMGLTEINKSENSTEELITEQSKGETQEQKENTDISKNTEITTEKESETTTQRQQQPQSNENSPRIILRNHKNVSLSYKDNDGNTALTVVYLKRGGDYFCHIKLGNDSELFIDESSKTLFEKITGGRLVTYVDAFDSYDLKFGDYFDLEIGKAEFLNKYTADLTSEPEISYDIAYSLPSFVSKLKSSSKSNVKTLTIKNEDESYSQDFTISRDTIINIIGDNYNLFIDKECENIYNCIDFIGGVYDMVIYAKEK